MSQPVYTLSVLLWQGHAFQWCLSYICLTITSHHWIFGQFCKSGSKTPFSLRGYEFASWTLALSLVSVGLTAISLKGCSGFDVQLFCVFSIINVGKVSVWTLFVSKHFLYYCIHNFTSSSHVGNSGKMLGICFKTWGSTAPINQHLEKIPSWKHGQRNCSCNVWGYSWWNDPFLPAGRNLLCTVS